MHDSFDAVNIGQLYELAVAAGYHPQQELIAQLKRLIPPGSRALELGCGTGLCLIPLIDHAVDCYGTDKSPQMTALIGHKRPEISGRIMEWDASSYSPLGPYDFIFSCNGPVVVKEDEFESYILHPDRLAAMLGNCASVSGSRIGSKSKLLINEGSVKRGLDLKLDAERTLLHTEVRLGDMVILSNVVIRNGQVEVVKTFVKRRYRMREMLDLAGIKLIKKEGMFFIFEKA